MKTKHNITCTLFVMMLLGIHGNDNTNVKIAAIDFQDFEVAGTLC